MKNEEIIHLTYLHTLSIDHLNIAWLKQPLRLPVFFISVVLNPQNCITHLQG